MSMTSLVVIAALLGADQEDPASLHGASDTDPASQVDPGDERAVAVLKARTSALQEYNWHGAGHRKSKGAGIGIGKGITSPADQPRDTVVLKSDPMAPVNDLLADLRKEVLDPVNLTFEPVAAYTFQHATKVRDGYPHSKSILFYAADGRLRLWRDSQGNVGEVVYNLQGNVGVGKPFRPFLGEAVGDPGIVNNILISRNFGLYMLYWQQAMFDGKVRLRVGKMENQVFFDRNAIAYDPLSGFLAQNFNQSMTNPFPEYAFGANLAVDLDDDVTIRGGVINSESTGITTGFDGLSWAHLLTMVEADLRVFPDIFGDVREGHLRFMYWYNGIDNPFGAGNIGGSGLTFNMDQAVYDNLSVFARVGWGENDVTVSNFAVSAGIACSAPFGLHHSDTGIAIAWAKQTRLSRQSVGLPPVPGEQTLVEWYWRTQLAESMFAGPVIQMVRDPGVVDTSMIYGFRMTWSF